MNELNMLVERKLSLSNFGLISLKMKILKRLKFVKHLLKLQLLEKVVLENQQFQKL